METRGHRYVGRSMGGRAEKCTLVTLKVAQGPVALCQTSYGSDRLKLLVIPYLTNIRVRTFS